MIVFSALSVCLITLMVLSATGNPALGLLAGLVSQLWMYPRHKQIEHFFSLVCCAVMFALFSNVGSPFWLGAIGAVGAAFGLNILTYFVGSAVLSFAVLWLYQGVAGLEMLPGFLIGLLGGMVLLILVAAMTPGFLRSYFDIKVLALLRRRTTNLPLPRPWIWKAHPQHFTELSPWRCRALQALFSLTPVVYVATLILFAQTTGEAHGAQLAVAASCCGLTYFHHALSRADLSHIQQVLQPMIVTVAAGVATTLSAPSATAAMLLAVIASTALLWNTHEFRRTWGIWQHKPVLLINGKDLFLISEGLKNRLTFLRKVVNVRSSPEDPIFVAPALPGLLALFHRKSAVYDTFPIYPASDAAQVRMIKELEYNEPTIAIISKRKIDHREDLRFEINYPLVFRHFTERYRLISETRAEYIFERREVFLPFSKNA